MSVAARRYDPRMRYGIALPNFTDVASPEAIEAAAAVAERLGWDAVWTTDHVLVDRSEDAADYRVNYDAIETLAWVGARHPSLRLGTSVLVVPQRNAVVLAKELATLDALSGGRVVAGVGVGWNAREFGNLAAEDRFAVRGAYLSETIALWRHLWSGSSEPFGGRSTTSTTSRSGRCRRRAPRSRSGSGRGPTRRCGASGGSRTATTRRRRARRRTPAGCR